MLARGLLEYETLTGDEIVALLKGIPPVRTPYEEPVLPAAARAQRAVGGQAASVRARADHQSRAAAYGNVAARSRHSHKNEAAPAALFYCRRLWPFPSP